ELDHAERQAAPAGTLLEKEDGTPVVPPDRERDSSQHRRGQDQARDRHQQIHASPRHTGFTSSNTFPAPEVDLASAVSSARRYSVSGNRWVIQPAVERRRSRNHSST